MNFDQYPNNRGRIGNNATAGHAGSDQSVGFFNNCRFSKSFPQSFKASK